MRLSRPARAAVTAVALALGLGVTSASGQGPNVLLVGPPGTAGAQYSTIQDAVNHAQAGDWVLVAPGVYHEKGFTPAPADIKDGNPQPAEVLITVPYLHLRGMNRDTVIVDGTNFSATQAAGTAPAGSAACASDLALQDPGVKDSSNHVHWREGILAWKAAGVYIENLSSCNSRDNEIWWNNGDGSGAQKPMPLWGNYITGTSTFYKDATTQSAQYGIFTSDVSGPSAGTGVAVSVIDNSYANNMTDSAYYVGACRNCYQVLNHPHAENSALGLSSTNAGGNFIVENGEWDLNRTGLVSNAQNNDDWPSPEYGQCVDTQPPPGAGTNSCYVMRGNKIHDNNNPNTPGTGLTAVSAVGTGVELAATQHISVINNQIYNQGAWGVVAHDFPDPENGPAECEGGSWIPTAPTITGTDGVCYWQSRGNASSGNTFKHNGFFGNVTNGDVANQGPGALDASACPRGNTGCTPVPNPDPSCFHNDTNTGGTVSAWPATLETSPCQVGPNNSETAVLTQELLCATGAVSLFTGGVQALSPTATCPSGSSYPQHDGKCIAPAVLTPANDPTNGVCFLPLSYTLSAAISPPMPDPCNGPPPNAFCNNLPAASLGSPNTGAPRPLPGPWFALLLLPAALLLAGSGLRRRARLV